MDENGSKAEAAEQFSQAADALVVACRNLESLGLDDPPVDRLMRALDDVTSHVHRIHPPDDRVKREPADVAVPACEIPRY